MPSLSFTRTCISSLMNRSCGSWKRSRPLCTQLCACWTSMHSEPPSGFGTTPQDFYLARVQWIEEGFLIAQVLNREQTEMAVLKLGWFGWSSRRFTLAYLGSAVLNFLKRGNPGNLIQRLDLSALFSKKRRMRPSWICTKPKSEATSAVNFSCSSAGFWQGQQMQQQRYGSTCIICWSPWRMDASFGPANAVASGAVVDTLPSSNIYQRQHLPISTFTDFIQYHLLVWIILNPCCTT